MKKLDLICNDGSPLSVTMKSLWGTDGRFGVGGAEQALLTMCQGWQERGYDVTLYNNPSEGGASPFKQKTLDEFDPLENRDYLIVFRSPNERVNEAKGKRIWWSCDQHTLGDFASFSKRVDRIVCISPRHATYFREMYGINDAIVIDLPVRLEDYGSKVEKIPHRCIYTSIPDRGVMQLHAAWPLVVQEVPDASLVITSDWRLWDKDLDASVVLPYQTAYARHPNVSYVGAVKRSQLIEYQQQADLLLYPATYDELFCITVAEAQVAGALPITSQYGSLPTTNEFGIQIAGAPTDPKFIEYFSHIAVKTLLDEDLPERQREMQKKAKERFALEKILDEWNERVFK